MALLKKIETALYPDIRKRYLVQSHKNLIRIMKQESKYFGLIELINSGCDTSSDSGNSPPSPFDSGNTTPNPFESGKTTPNPFGHIFKVDI
jgi:hypothetical protein